tara:strand:+ start:230 stop:1231 length:1002 start_codon:yes stop_codon:yes gene_type:complete
LKIADKNIGEGFLPFLIAEVGINHNGSIDLAKETILSAHKAGASAVKIQTFKANSLCAEDSQYFSIFKKCEFNEHELKELYTFANNNKINLFSTVFDEWAVDICSTLNPPCIKIASGDITHIPLIEYTASKGFPIILSTGASSIQEIDDAVKAIKRINQKLEYCILHCISNYPTKPSEVNLLAMKTLEEKFRVPIGFSDHTHGNEISLAAISLGANIIEKHFTLDKGLEGPDHSLSSDPKEFENLVQSSVNISMAFGKKEKQAVESKDLIKQIRRSIFANSNIISGTILEKNMISITRPEIGIQPRYLNDILGKKIKNTINKGSPITWEDIDI